MHPTRSIAGLHQSRGTGPDRSWLPVGRTQVFHLPARLDEVVGARRLTAERQAAEAAGGEDAGRSESAEPRLAASPGHPGDDPDQDRPGRLPAS